MTPDPYQASVGPSDPGSWNRYAHTRGDPINRQDPSGLDDCGSEDGTSCSGPISFPGGCTLYPNGTYVCPPAGGLQAEKGRGPTTSNQSFVDATNRLSKAAQAIEKKTNFSKQCMDDIAAIAANNPQVSIDAIKNALGGTTYYNGVGSQVSASVLYPNAPQAAALRANQTIWSLMNKPGFQVAAETALGADFMFINAAYISTSTSVNEGFLMHEALHELGLDDNAIGIALQAIDPSIQPDKDDPNNWSNTKQFSDKFTKDCF